MKPGLLEAKANVKSLVISIYAFKKPKKQRKHTEEHKRIVVVSK
jgi:hypothetical protein